VGIKWSRQLATLAPKVTVPHTCQCVTASSPLASKAKHSFWVDIMLHELEMCTKLLHPNQRVSVISCLYLALCCQIIYRKQRVLKGNTNFGFLSHALPMIFRPSGGIFPDIRSFVQLPLSGWYSDINVHHESRLLNLYYCLVGLTKCSIRSNPVYCLAYSWRLAMLTLSCLSCGLDSFLRHPEPIVNCSILQFAYRMYKVPCRGSS